MKYKNLTSDKCPAGQNHFKRKEFFCISHHRYNYFLNYKEEIETDWIKQSAKPKNQHVTSALICTTPRQEISDLSTTSVIRHGYLPKRPVGESLKSTVVQVTSLPFDLEQSKTAKTRKKQRINSMKQQKRIKSRKQLKVQFE